ncbi:MAG TPA: BadF/BadG/BcrA/BcrD ATPase family protein [Thermoanaerobaculia bacterium]|nr:BadF/BadG/BcrA/BcrD ATPase family protein [Thermoanaerobaculia bacterium]
MAAFWIGVDGGGTRTRAVVAGEDLVPMGSGASGPANASTRPLPLVVETVLEAAGDAAASATVAAARAEKVGVGLAGVESAGLVAPLTAALEEHFGAGRVLVTTDARIALAGASPGDPQGPGVVLIAGTGAIAYGRSAGGAEARAGGWGPLLGDEGSGYAIARQGLAAVVRDLDGRGPKTAIREMLFRSARGIHTLEELLAKIYRSEGGAGDVAAYFPIVLAAAKAGDAEARRILGEAGRELALAALTVIRKLRLENSSFPVSTVGGVFSAGDLLVGPLAAALHAVAPGAQVGPPAYPPEIGAIRLARARAEALP